MRVDKRHQIKLGDYYTYDTWHLVPNEIPTVVSPEVKTEIVEIPQFSVRYDFTEALQGSVPYGSRQGEWTFHVIGGDEALRRTIEDAIHGKRLSVIIDVDTTDAHTYNGRVYLSSWTNHGGINTKWAECTISYDLDA